jgi:hypothetical protein
MRTPKQKKHDYFRAKENAGKYHWDRMTKTEKEWLIAFEVSEYEAERGHISEAVEALINVGTIPTDNYVQGMRSRYAAERTGNPQKAETHVRLDRAKDNYQGIRAPKSSLYDSSDYVRVLRGAVDKDDLSYEPPTSKSEVFVQVNGAEGYVEGYKVEKETSPDNLAVMINPEDGMIEAIDHAAKKNRSLEKLVMDAKLSKEATELLNAKMQTMTYAATTYSKHANLILDMNFILKAPNGQLWVIDQHNRLQTMALYLKRRTSESIVTHAEVSYPGLLQNWVFLKGKRSDIEGKAVQYEGV